MRADRDRGYCFPASDQAWKMIRDNAAWNRSNPAPDYWGRMDILWQIGTGNTSSERDIATFLGWTRRQVMRALRAAQADLSAWFPQSQTGDPQVIHERSTSDPEVIQSGTGERQQLYQKRSTSDPEVIHDRSSTAPGAGFSTSTPPPTALARPSGDPQVIHERSRSDPEVIQSGTGERQQLYQKRSTSDPEVIHDRSTGDPLTRADPLRELNTNTLSDLKKEESEKPAAAFGGVSAGVEVEAAPSVPEAREVPPNQNQRPIVRRTMPNIGRGSTIDCGGFQRASAEVAAILSERPGQGERTVLVNPPWHLKKKLGLLTDEDTAVSVPPEPEPVPPSPLEGIDLPTFFSTGPGGAEGGSLGGFQKLVVSLVGADIKTAKDLEDMTLERLRFLPGIGSNHAQAIESRMITWGSSLAPDPEARFRELVRLASRHPKPPPEVNERDRRWLATALISWGDLRKSTEFTVGSLCKSFVAGSTKKARAA